MSSGTIRVVNWEEFQHYKDRDPIWIKLHRSLLDNYGWSRLHDASRALLIGLWLLAARHNNAIPADLEWIAKRISAHGDLDLQPLVDGGFIEVDGSVEQPASTLGQVASPRALARGEERRGEKRRKPDASAPGDTPNWVAAIHTELLQVGACSYGQIGKLCKDLYALHGDRLIAAAGAYRRDRHRRGVDGSRFVKKGVVADFADQAGVFVDHIAPIGETDTGRELLAEANR